MFILSTLMSIFILFVNAGDLFEHALSLWVSLNIYDGAFLQKWFTGFIVHLFFVKSSIVNIGQGPKYAYSFTRNWWPIYSSSNFINCLLENLICYSSFLGIETYLEPSRTFTTELFWENSKQFLPEKAPLQMFDQVRNTPLVHVMGLYCFDNPYTLSFLYTDKIEKNV